MLFGGIVVCILKNIKVTTEQVEAQGDFEALRTIGVDFIQGNFVDPPHRLGEAGGEMTVH